MAIDRVQNDDGLGSTSPECKDVKETSGSIGKECFQTINPALGLQS